jgi:hypothetical protein
MVLHSEPLIVNPRNHIDEAEMDEIYSQFEKARGKERESGPPMFIVAPYDKMEVQLDDSNTRNAVNKSEHSSWSPSTLSPEWVVVSRIATLAKRSYEFMIQQVMDFDDSTNWSAIFYESSSSFHSYSVLLRISPDFVIDRESSSTGTNLCPASNEDGTLESSYTRSMKTRFDGPKALRRKVYRNLHYQRNDWDNALIMSWQPIEGVISSLRRFFGSYALFFYNEFSPEVIGVLWRPETFKPMPFSAMTAEFAMPRDLNASNWKNDCLVVRNAEDLLREMSEYYKCVVVTAKILDHKVPTKKRKREGLDV